MNLITERSLMWLISFPSALQLWHKATVWEGRKPVGVFFFFHIHFALKHFRSLRRAQQKATVTTIALYNGENRLINRPEMMTTQQKYNFIMTTVREQISSVSRQV